MVVRKQTNHGKDTERKRKQKQSEWDTCFLKQQTEQGDNTEGSTRDCYDTNTGHNKEHLTGYETVFNTDSSL